MRGLRIIRRFVAAAGIAALASVAAAEKRVALVIGNSAYQHTVALPNPVNDAGDLGGSLERLGFQVIRATDLDKRGMDRAIGSFARAATDADAALFFYAGHGMQFQGSNYLMPVDAKLEDEVTLTFEMTRVDDVLSAISRARGVKLLILDACRDNPLAKRLETRATTRSLGPTRGLARIERSQGTVIAFATQANDVAIDGVGSRNSPFTGALLREIEKPNVEVGTLFRRVAAEVNRVTEGRQTPELSVSILGEFYFQKFDADADRLAREQAEARARLTRDLEDQQRVARETAERIRAGNERVLKELADRERRAKEELARLAGSTPPAAPALPALTPIAPIASAPAPVPPPQLAPGPTVAALAPQPVVQPPQPPVAPTAIPPLAGADLVKALKAELRRVGCYAGPLDAAWPTRPGDRALAEFHRHSGNPAAPLSAELLAVVKSHPDRVCPLTCARGQEGRGGVCVALAPPPAPRAPRPAIAPPAAKPRVVVQPRPVPAPRRPVAERRPVERRPVERLPVERAEPPKPAFKRCFHIGGLNPSVTPLCE